MSATSPPLSSTEVRETWLVSIGGVSARLAFSGASATLLADLEGRYRPFLLSRHRGFGGAGAASFNVGFDLHVTLEPRAVAPVDPERAALPPMLRWQREDRRDERVEIERLDFHAMLARDADGVFRGAGTCQANPVAFESLMRVLWSVFLPRAGGALFHACGFRIDGERGLLAIGPSGAGKTTLARKVDVPKVLSDEVVAVHRDGTGWRLSATPFFGELQRNGGSRASVALGGIAVLAKAPTLAVRPLAAGEAVRRVLECLLCFETDAATAAQNFEIGLALCRDVPPFVCASARVTPLAEMLAAIEPQLVPSHAVAAMGHEMAEARAR